jgi:DNA-binding transcriptional regulator GbsR (MarR family)
MYGKPAPPMIIAEATGLSSSKVSQVLKSLVKYKIVKIAYHRKIPFYTLTKGERDGGKIRRDRFENI